MEKMHLIVQVVVLAISVLGVVVVVWGVVRAAASFVSLKLSGGREQIQGIESIRHHLGSHLLLGLEVFIAADILSSVVSPTLEKVGVLAAIVGVRVVLSYFLRMEIRKQ